MISDVFYFFPGTYRISVAKDDKSAVVNLMYSNEINYFSPQIKKDESYSFKIFSKNIDVLRNLFDENGICYEVSDISGLPKILHFLKRRPGIIAGIIIFVCAMWLSTRVIWGVTVTGNSNVSDAEILAALDELGCGYGNYIPRIDFDLLHAKFLASNKDISWISVNMKGTRANVQVRETSYGRGKTREADVYANVVAAEDAQIMIAQVFEGATEVFPGDVVKKGDVLISGIIPVGEDKMRYEYASGEVLGYVMRTVESEIPFEGEVKKYTGRKKNEKAIKLFNKSVNLFIDEGVEYTKYDKIQTNEQVKLFGSVELPIWTSKTEYREYEYAPANLTPNEAIAKAMDDLRWKMDETLENAELISKSVSTDLSDTGFKIRYDLKCLVNIAETREFNVN